MDYFEKLESNLYSDLKWNVPERKQGIINVIGGSTGNFRTEIKVAEFVSTKYPVQEVKVVVPETLRGMLPDLPNFVFLPSTDSGGFDESQKLMDIFSAADYNLVLGDLSKNVTTGRAIANAVKHTKKMTLLTRDTVDVLIGNNPDKWLMNENLVIFASIAQLQKLLRAIYYPKMLLMSSSLVQVAEVLHKFTLSYPVSIISLHNEQIIIAKNGSIKALPLEKTGCSPVMLWSGEMAGDVVMMNLYNPNQFIEATVNAFLH